MLRRNNFPKWLLCISGALFCGILYAQQPDETSKRALEREVKTSGDYLYGEATGKTKDEAIKAAKSALLSEIKSEALQHPEWEFAKTIQANGVEYNTDMIDLMRGSKYRVIAFVKKDSIAAVFNINIPKVKISDKQIVQAKIQPAEVMPTKFQAAEDSKEVSVQGKAIPTVEDTKASVPAQIKKDTIISFVKPKVQANGLLGEILNASSYNEIMKILDANKRNGKAVHGKMNKLTVLEKAYLIVYQESGKIVAILDKGSSDNRKDLLSGDVKGQEIQKQNKVIWFQLF